MTARRLAIVVTHPIQHFVPFYRALAAEPGIDLHVLFGAPIGVKPYFDAEMNTEIAWKMDMLGGYAHEFLDRREGLTVSFSTPDAPQLGTRLAAFAPDAVLIYGYAQRNALRALWWANRHRVPAIIISDSELLAERSALKLLVKFVVVRLLFRRFAAFLSVGDNNERYYRSYGAPANRIFRSPFTIDEPTYRAAAANRVALRSRMRAEHGICEEEKVLLFVGKLSPRKRPGDLLAALRRLPAGYRAVFAGNGDQLESLRAEAEEENLPALFLGFVNVDALPSVYAAADVLVHPSQADPHPLICSEAACIGLPMVLSDRVGAVGPTDIARDGANSRVFPCGDTRALAETILSVFTADRANGMAARSRHIFDELDLRRSIAGLTSAIDAVVN